VTVVSCDEAIPHCCLSYDFFVAPTLELFFFLINAVFSNSRLEARYVYSLVISFV
jgi:hypothetical protein